MPIEKAPNNPLPRNYVPPGGTPYRVRTNDDWGSVAKAHGLTARDLMHFNYNTIDPPEVNWYLKRNAGCVKPTHDGKNWMFTSEAVPGIIFLPPKAGWKRPVFPPKSLATKPDEPSGIWFGFGVQGGGHFFLVGKDTLEGCIYSLESYQKRFWMNVDGWRLGPGLGGGAGAVLILIGSLRAWNQLQGFMIGGWDLHADLEERWADLGKAGSKIPGLARIAKTVVKGAIKFEEWWKMAEIVRSVWEAVELETDAAEPDVKILPIPFVSKGLELSLYYGVGTIYVSAAPLG